MSANCMFSEAPRKASLPHGMLLPRYFEWNVPQRTEREARPHTTASQASSESPTNKRAGEKALNAGELLQREVKGQRGRKGNPKISTSRKPVLSIMGTKGRGEVTRAQEPELPREPQEDHLTPARDGQSRKMALRFSSG